MLDTSARLLHLLSTLQRRSEWGGPELAETLGVTTRTLRRDIDRLRALGYAVDAEPGPGGGYRLGQGKALPPIAFEDDEAVAVAIALASAADTFVGLEPAAVGALLKLTQLSPRRIQRKVNAVRAMTVSIGAGPRIDPEILVNLALACRDQLELIFSYQSHEGADSLRKVEPIRLAHTGNRRWYLVAWDLGREAFRTFRVDRIRQRPVLGPHFTPRPLPKDFEAYVSESLTAAPYRYRAVAKIWAAAEEVKERVPPWAGQVEPIDRRSCRLTTGADTLEALALQLLYPQADLELLEPAELGPELRRLARRLHRAAASPKKGPKRRRVGPSFSS